LHAERDAQPQRAVAHLLHQGAHVRGCSGRAGSGLACPPKSKNQSGRADVGICCARLRSSSNKMVLK
jgi:hypothetical protein